MVFELYSDHDLRALSLPASKSSSCFSASNIFFRNVSSAHCCFDPFIALVDSHAPSSDLKEEDFPLGFELIGAEAAAAATAAAAEAEAKAEKAAAAVAATAEAGAQDGEVCRTRSARCHNVLAS